MLARVCTAEKTQQLHDSTFIQKQYDLRAEAKTVGTKICFQQTCKFHI